MFGVRTVLSRDTTVDTRCLMGLCSVVCYLLGATAPFGDWSYRACSVNSVCTGTESTVGTVSNIFSVRSRSFCLGRGDILVGLDVSSDLLIGVTR